MPAQIVFDKGFIQGPRHLMPEGSLVEASNVLPGEPGALTSRLGHTFLGSVDERDVYFLHIAYDESQHTIRYQGAGAKLYRHFNPILTGLTGTHISAVTMRTGQELRTVTFFANGQALMRVKDDGTTLSAWGL